MDAKEKRRVELAEYKCGLIAPAVNGTYPDASMAEYFRRVCAEPVGLPDGTRVRLKPSTLASWRRRYLHLGFEGLMPKGRSDLGTSRRIDADLGADIQAMRAESPRISAKMVHERLVEEGHVAAGELSVATVQRWLSPVKIVDREISDSQAARSTSASHEMASSKRAKNSSITSAGTRSPIASWGR